LYFHVKIGFPDVWGCFIMEMQKICTLTKNVLLVTVISKGVVVISNHEKRERSPIIAVSKGVMLKIAYNKNTDT